MTISQPRTSTRKMKVFFQELGGHTHLKIFTGRAIENATLGKAGELCMTNEEFAAWRDNTIVLEFIESGNTVRDTHTTAVPESATEGAR